MCKTEYVDIPSAVEAKRSALFSDVAGKQVCQHTGVIMLSALCGLLSYCCTLHRDDTQVLGIRRLDGALQFTDTEDIDVFSHEVCGPVRGQSFCCSWLHTHAGFGGDRDKHLTILAAMTSWRCDAKVLVVHIIAILAGADGQSLDPGC